MNLWYFLVVENATDEQRSEVDSVLAGPRDPYERAKRAHIARLGGGEVR